MPVKVKSLKLSEAEFLKQVIKLAKLKGWRVAHFRPGMTRKGRWITPVQGDGAGFPDLILLRNKTCLVVELKVGKNVMTLEQRVWMACFAEAGILAMVWRPEQWGIIEAALE